MVGGLIQALVALNNESYVPERWHQTLFTIAVISSSIIFNTVLAVKLPLIEGALWEQASETHSSARLAN